MGCVSSKLLSTTDLDQGFLYHNKKAIGDFPNHVVSLTSTTYGVLNLDPCEAKGKEEEGEASSKATAWKRSTPALTLPHFKRRVSKEGPPEIINAWELMEGLSDETPIWSPLKKPMKSLVSMHRSTARESTMSPIKQKRIFGGKENNPIRQGSGRSDPDPSRALRPFSSLENTKWIGPNSTIQPKNSPTDVKFQKSAKASRLSWSGRSFSPVFDPELLASFERELCEEEEQIKKMVAPLPKNRKAQDSNQLLQSFEEKCPPFGENAVVLYTTTLRGIRKTFEDCNAVRTAIESHDVQIVERDISMDSGFREELRVLMGKKEVKAPVVFVKGRMIGGAEEVLQLEEEGKLGLLLEGIPKAAVWCEGCAGVRFIMCVDCSGSCKVLDEEQKKMVKCGECNENGLIHCPICS